MHDIAKMDPAVIKAHRAGPGFQAVKLCNCAKCGCELVGESDRSQSYHSTHYAIPVVFGRFRGRPYCQRCYRQVEEFQRQQPAGVSADKPF